jgi:hypothetical protein
LSRSTLASAFAKVNQKVKTKWTLSILPESVGLHESPLLQLAKQVVGTRKSRGLHQSRQRRRFILLSKCWIMWSILRGFRGLARSPLRLWCETKEIEAMGAELISAAKNVRR